MLTRGDFTMRSIFAAILFALSLPLTAVDQPQSVAPAQPVEPAASQGITAPEESWRNWHPEIPTVTAAEIDVGTGLQRNQLMGKRFKGTGTVEIARDQPLVLFRTREGDAEAMQRGAHLVNVAGTFDPPLQVGEKVWVEAMIVDESYAALVLYVYFATREEVTEVVPEQPE